MSIFGRKGNGSILKVQDAILHWDCEDPFIFATHHYDLYPKGNTQQAPPYEEIRRRSLGHDYDKLFGYRMYDGKVSPGFPLHPHWGYETFSVASKGYVDHFDNRGNQGRYGYGDMQWVSAGSLYCHDEIYPLAFMDRDNPVLLTQIHVNLPLEKKGTEPVVRTVWMEDIPAVKGEGWTASVYCGEFADVKGVPANPVSWAADPSHHVSIVKLDMEPGASVEVGPTEAAHRNVYVTDGKATVEGEEFPHDTRLKMDTSATFTITMGKEPCEVWILEGDPIGEKQAAFGPAVLGSLDEVRKANRYVNEHIMDGWCWDYVNEKQDLGTERFFQAADGTVSAPKSRNPGEGEPQVLPEPEEKPQSDGQSAERSSGSLSPRIHFKGSAADAGSSTGSA